MKVVAYYCNWARWRSGTGKFSPGNIKTSLVTHIIYSFATLNPSSLTMQMLNEDIDDLNQVVKLKQQGVKVLIAIGGWNDSKQSNKYSRLVESSSARAAFISNCLQFLQTHGLDGLDIDWEYPSDKTNFSSFVRELSEAFQPRGYLLTAAVSAGKYQIDGSYNVSSLANYLDWINLMAYDFHGPWETKTGHVAPFDQQPGDDASLNVQYGANYWRQLGMPANKIVVGIPCYGKSFTLQNPNQNGINAPASGPGHAGEFTKAEGTLAYYEIMQNVRKGQMAVVNNSFGSYAYGGDQWVSYDSVDDVIKKAKFIRGEGFGGAMIWSLDFDDFNGGYPLLSAISNKLLN